MRHVTVLSRLAIAALAAGLVSACTDRADRPAASPGVTIATTTEVTAGRLETLPQPSPEPQRQLFPPYEPSADERYSNGKRLAGRVAQQLTTFERGASAAEIARGVTAAGAAAAARLERAVAPLVDPKLQSAGEVIYVQLSGVTATTLGAMVLVRQHLADATKARAPVVRVIDVRLRRVGASWSLDRVGSVGGTAVARPPNLSPASKRVLDHPNIELPDTARWDIHRGGIDEGLLRALADAADRWPLAVTVLRTGHPHNVWATDRPSAHTAGRAADIYAVGGTLVVRQRLKDGKARAVAAALLDAGAAQVGSPWVLRPGGKRSFSDLVHEDHIHVQQTVSSRHVSGAPRS